MTGRRGSGAKGKCEEGAQKPIPARQPGQVRIERAQFFNMGPIMVRRDGNVKCPEIDVGERGSTRPALNLIGPIGN